MQVLTENTIQPRLTMKIRTTLYYAGFILVLFTAGNGISQNSEFADTNKVTYSFQSGGIEKLITLYDAYTKKNPGYQGYRIEIYSGSGADSKKRAREIQKKFSDQFEDIPSYLKWKYPNFEVRAGDFRTRQEAESAFLKIKKEFPYAYIKQDVIEPPVLSKEEAEAKEDIDDAGKRPGE